MLSACSFQMPGHLTSFKFKPSIVKKNNNKKKQKKTRYLIMLSFAEMFVAKHCSLNNKKKIQMFLLNMAEISLVK